MPRGETSVTLTFHGSSSFPLDEEVPEDWVLEMLMLSFNMNKQEAGNYVIALKNNLKSESGENNELQPIMVWIEDGETKESKVGFARIWIKERPDIKAIYEYLDGRSTSSNLFFYYPGSYEENFYIDDEWVGSMNYLIPLITITKIDREHAYYLNIDTKGTISIKIKLKEMSKEIPESEYKAVLKEMFVNLGLSPEWVNEFDFNYYPYTSL